MPPGSSATLDFPDIERVYARFAALSAASADLGGRLLLYCGLDRDGVAVAIASNVAGAASLGIEPDTLRAKLALRAGVCDFLVNHLDEALRILKNEIRKRKAVSVVLASGADTADTAVAEITARGLQPDLLAFPVRELMERGAYVLAADAEDARTRMMWSVASEPARWLPSLDALAGAALQFADERVRWLEAAPRYLGRSFEGQRFLPMTDLEADSLMAAIRAEVRTGGIPVAVLLTRGGEAISIAP
jgi:Urocanase Rossmann-like domain